ncbi:hypothetical protein CEP54_013197 [Fusarium duplospermum]|uniref:Uncharacterized protein n=1 Tax=Fusarium duplospermum TaxID=1325734 RepID=A0A428P4C3_9HYPO|nr:hypothetical protein CEP54_013197 [Fusarium duplospermum]
MDHDKITYVRGRDGQRYIDEEAITEEEVLVRIPVVELHQRGIVLWLNSTQSVWVLDVSKKERKARMINYIMFPENISDLIPRGCDK